MTSTEEKKTNYEMIGYGRKQRTREKGEEYVSFSVGKLKADMSSFETGTTVTTYAIYTNTAKDGTTELVVKTRPPKGSKERGRKVGTAETINSKKGPGIAVSFDDEAAKPIYLWPNKTRRGANPADYFVTTPGEEE